MNKAISAGGVDGRMFRALDVERGGRVPAQADLRAPVRSSLASGGRREVDGLGVLAPAAGLYMAVRGSAARLASGHVHIVDSVAMPKPVRRCLRR